MPPIEQKLRFWFCAPGVGDLGKLVRNQAGK